MICRKPSSFCELKCTPRVPVILYWWHAFIPSLSWFCPSSMAKCRGPSLLELSPQHNPWPTCACHHVSPVKEAATTLTRGLKHWSLFQYHILSRSQKWSLNQSKTYFHTFSLGQLSYGEFVTSAIHPVDYLEPWLGFREVVAQLGVNLLLRFLKMQCSVFKRKLAFCLRPWKYWLEILSVLWIFIKDYI